MKSFPPISQISLKIPDNLETYTIKDKKGNVLVLREPVWADYALIKELEGIDNETKLIQLALRLAVSYNGEPGVTITDLMQLDRFAVKEVYSLLISFQLDIVPDLGDRAKDILQEYLSNQ